MTEIIISLNPDSTIIGFMARKRILEGIKIMTTIEAMIEKYTILQTVTATMIPEMIEVGLQALPAIHHMIEEIHHHHLKNHQTCHSQITS